MGKKLDKPEPTRLAQMPLVTAMLKEADKQGFKGMTAKRFNAIIAAANSVVEVFGQPIVMASDNMGLEAWRTSDDTGVSSMFMADVLSDGSPRSAFDKYPSDPDDFGRCYRLLRAAPELRGNLSLLSQCGPVWAAYIARWADMEKLYEEEFPGGDGPKLYALMQQLRGDAEKAGPVDVGG